jgi:hypothetical protein
MMAQSVKIPKPLANGTTDVAYTPEQDTTIPEGFSATPPEVPEGFSPAPTVPAGFAETAPATTQEAVQSKPGFLGRAWDFVNRPLVTEDSDEQRARAYSTSAPSNFDVKHPIISGAAKGAAGAFADTSKTLRQLATSPLGLITVGSAPALKGVAGAIPALEGSVPALANAAKTALPVISEYGELLAKPASILFGGEGLAQAEQGRENIKQHGVTPEGTEQVLSGLGMAALGAHGALHELPGKSNYKPGKPQLESALDTSSKTPKGGLPKIQPTSPLSRVPYPEATEIAANTQPHADTTEAVSEGRANKLPTRVKESKPQRQAKGLGTIEIPKGFSPTAETGKALGEIPVPDQEITPEQVQTSKAIKSRFSDADIKSLQQMGLSEHDIEQLSKSATPSAKEEPNTVANGSAPGAEGAASVEATNRQASEKANGTKRIKVLQNGQEVPLIGPDAVDAVAGKGETIVKRYADGHEEIQDQGNGARYNQKPTPEPDLDMEMRGATDNPPAKPKDTGLSLADWHRLGELEERNTRRTEQKKKLEAGQAEEPAVEQEREPGLVGSSYKEEGEPSAEEYHPSVKEQVSLLRNEKLKELGQQYGLNPDEYDFSRREALREGGSKHPVERHKFVDDLMAAMPEDEVKNVGRQVRDLEHNQDQAQFHKADRAESMFSKLRKSETVGTAEGAKQDTDFFQQAKAENPSGTVSDWAKRAQELKDEPKGPQIPEGFKAEDPTESQVKIHNEEGGSTFNADGENLKGADKYSVGAYPDKTEKVEGDLTAAKLRDFQTKNAELLDKDHGVGTWKDDNGTTWLDVVKLIGDRDKAIEAGKQYNQKAIFGLKNGELIDTGGTGEAPAPEPETVRQDLGKLKAKGPAPEATAETAKMSNEELLKHGFTQADIDAGLHLPKVKGSAAGAAVAPAEVGPTSEKLAKKYGTTTDPLKAAFILPDGRMVPLQGEHDTMLSATEGKGAKNREGLINDENAIRTRFRQTRAGDEVVFSIPEHVTEEQMQKMRAAVGQMGRYGNVVIEQAKSAGGRFAKEHALVSHIDEGVKHLGAEPLQAPDIIPEEFSSRLDKEERASLRTPVSQKNFVEKAKALPELQEFVDIANRGAGERTWYQRGSAAVKAVAESAPDYFNKPGDQDRFLDVIAALSPRQAVAENMTEALRVWKEYVDQGRPEGKQLKKLLNEQIGINRGSKIPNAMKAFAGEELWPDLSKNRNFKVPSFSANLKGMLNKVTSDGWMAAFADMTPGELSNPSSYHPLAAVTRAAAEHLGWEPAEARAAIWAFVKTLTEKGETVPEEIRAYSKDFADIIAEDDTIRQQLRDMGVNDGELERKLKGIQAKPEVEGRSTPTTEDSVRKLIERLEKQGREIPEPRSNQRKLGFEDEDTSFDPEEFAMSSLGEKESPLGKASKRKK